MQSRATLSASAVAAALVVALGLSAAGAVGSSSSNGLSPGVVRALAQPGPTSPLASDRIYFVMPDRYANGDPSNDSGGQTGSVDVTGYDPTSTAWWHGGDFKGLTGDCTDPTHGLARIKKLGFNAIWVTPPVVNQVTNGGTGGYHGYWGTDFLHVDPHLGTDQDFADFVTCAHSLGLKVIQDVVVNHTGDLIQVQEPDLYAGGPYRDCHGKRFNPAKYVGKKRFPCLSAANMPKQPFFLDAVDRNAKSPAWLDNPLNYHDRGNINFGSCSEQCNEWGDFFGLDDLFTEKPNVEQGLAAIYASWITRFHVDGFRVDTVPYVNPGFFKLWVPQIMKAAKAAGEPNFQIFGEVFNADPIAQSTYVRDRGMPSVLDFPFQSVASGYVAGASSALGVGDRLSADDYFRVANGSDPEPPTFLGNHDMGRAAFQIQTQAPGLSPAELLQRVELGHELMYFLRGAPVVMYGDEVGMIGTGGDQQARQDMFPTQVDEWQTQDRVGSPPIGTGSSFDVTKNPLESLLPQLAAIRAANPALESGASIVRYAHQSLLAVSRIDASARREYLVLTNSGTSAASLTVSTATPSSTWNVLFGNAGTLTSDSGGKLHVTVPAVGAILLEAATPFPVSRAPKPTLKVGGDALSNLFVAKAKVSGRQPLTVAFAYRRAGSSKWTRLDVDDSPPYRGFLEAGRFKKHERLELVAITRSLDGSTATSKVVGFRLPGH
jgi:alpha-amylase